MPTNPSAPSSARRHLYFSRRAVGVVLGSIVLLGIGAVIGVTLGKMLGLRDLMPGGGLSAVAGKEGAVAQKFAAARNPIAQICAQPGRQQVLSSEFVRGSVNLVFKDSTTNAQRKAFLADGGYTVTRNILDEPVHVDIMLQDSFTARYPATVAEINDFLNRARHESYVKSVGVGSNWYSGPMQDPSTALADTVDRWGTFEVTLTDAAKRDEFLKRYPEATFLDIGQTAAADKEHIFSDPTKLDIMYKGTPALAIAQQIKAEASLPDTYPAFDPSTSPPRSTLYSDSMVRNATDTRYISMPALLFSGDFTEPQIRAILARHPEVFTNVEIRDLTYSTKAYVNILVPENQERCWEAEILKLPEIQSAYEDMVAHAD